MPMPLWISTVGVFAVFFLGFGFFGRTSLRHYARNERRAPWWYIPAGARCLQEPWPAVGPEP